MALVSAGRVRRWISRTQRAHATLGDRAGNWYFALLFVLIVGGMIHQRLLAIVWPDQQHVSRLAAAGLILALSGALYLTLRRLGPLGISRPAASWLLTAPVSRRSLLLPGFGVALALAAVTGALGALGVAGHAIARPLGDLAGTLPLAGALIAVALFLVALAAQEDRRWTSWSDRIAGLLVAAGLGTLVVDSAVAAPLAPAGWPPAGVVVAVAGTLAVICLAGLALAVRRLGRTPNDSLLESARTAGTLWDSAYAAEPSFVVDMIERRQWSRRRLRSVRLPARVPVLVAQDLLLLRRRPGRMLWFAGSAALPALVAAASPWLLGAVVLIGGMVAAGVTTATLRTDTGNPWMLRMLGISSRDAVLQRSVVPVALATVWSALALGVLQALGHLPAGPWWLLGIALGPVGGVAAVRKARAGFVDNGLLPLDTPMGSVATGPLLAAVSGVDVLLIGVPSLILIGQDLPLGWSGVATQAVLAVASWRFYLSGTTDKDKVELG